MSTGEPTEGMRWKVSKAVRASDLPSSSKLVMLVLLDVAEVGTAEIPPHRTPSLTVLAGETSLARSTVADHLKALEAEGWVVRARPSTAEALGRGERTRYQLRVPAAVASPTADLVQEPDLVRSPDQEPSAVVGLPSADTGLPSAVVGPPSPVVGHRYRSYSDKNLDKNNNSPSGSSARTQTRTRGTRVPADFVVTAEMRDWATAEATQVRQQAPDPDRFPDWLDRATQQFRDYWAGVSGQRGVKLDWPATWRNWMRKELDQVAQQPGRVPAAANKRSENRHIDDLTPEQRAARNPFAGAVRASQATAGGTS